MENAALTATAWNRSSEDRVESWDQIYQTHLSMLESQSIVRYVTLGAFITVIGFGIYNILNMVVMNKKRDIAIIRTMGYSEQDVARLYLFQGLILAVLGSLTGLGLGYLVCKYVETIPVPIGKGHMIISWDVMIYIKAFLFITGASLCASYFPARSAGRMNPITVIRSSA